MGGAGRLDALDGLGVDGLHGLREELGENACGVDPEREHAGEGTEPDRDHEEHGEDHLVDRAKRVHHAADRLIDPDGHHVLGRENAEGHGADNGEEGAPDGDLYRDQHLGQVELPFEEVWRKEALGEGRHVAGVADEVGGPHVGPVPRPGEDREKHAPQREIDDGPLAVHRRHQRLRRCLGSGGERRGLVGHAGARKTGLAGARRSSTADAPRSGLYL